MNGGRARAAWASVLAAAALFAGCFGGGGTETETVGVLRNADGSPAAKVSVRFRPVDFLADTLWEGRATPDWDTWTDGNGRFSMKGLAPGAYRMHADGGNGRGVVKDFLLGEKDQRLELDPDTLRPHGSITGRIVLDTTAELKLHVQVFGMEIRQIADPDDGTFWVGNLPPGRYKLRFLGIGPYSRQAVKDSQGVESESVTRIDSVVLDEAAKLTVSKDSAGALVIDGLRPGSPVIFDNEFWDNGPENEYVWAKASAGDLDLRGNIVTDAMRKGSLTLIPQLAKAAWELRTARLAGLQGIPAPVAGSSHPLPSIINGPLEKLPFEASEGSDLIVDQARRCSPESPLVVVVGGPLTTVANAYLQDRTIASRMIVVAIYPFSLNSADVVSTYLVAKRCRLVVWGRDYVWNGSLDQARIPDLPGSRMGEALKSYLMARSRMNGLPLGDVAPIAYLFDRGVWTGSKMYRFAPPLDVQPASDVAFDFLDIPEDANDWDAYQREFFSAFANAAAFPPFLLPGRLDAEGYAARSGARGTLSAPGSAPDTTYGDAMAGNAGAWLDFRTSLPAAAAGRVIVRYRAPSGGLLSLAYGGGPVLAEIRLAPGEGWADAEATVSFAAGTGTLRATWSEGDFDLDALDFRIP